jgi:hypothetical protein
MFSIVAMDVPAAAIPRLPPPKPPAQEKSLKSWATLLLLVVIGGLAGYFGAKVGARLGADALLRGPGPKWVGLLPVLALPLVWLVAVAAHEFGHLAGGWAGGGKFLLYVVGPFKWQRTPTGIRFSWNWSVNLGGGMAACLPLDAARVTPRRMALMIAGGPLASLLLAVATLWLAAALAAPATQGLLRNFAQNLSLSVTGISLLVFLLTVFPSTLGGFKSDGRRFYELLRGDRRSDQEKAMMALTTAALSGMRPADLDAGLVGESVALRDGSIFDLYAHFTAYQHAIDRGEVARAQTLLDYVMTGEARLVPFIRDAARCEYAWLLATRAEAPAAARAWLDSAGAVAFDPATRLRAEAAVLLTEGRAREAAAKAREGLHALRHKSMSPVENPFAREALEAVIRRAERAPAD